MADYCTEAVITPKIPTELLTTEDFALLELFNISRYNLNGSWYLHATQWDPNYYEFDGDGDIDHTEEELFKFFQALLNRKECKLKYIAIEMAHTCNRPRPDGFGGTAIFITKDDIKYIGTSEWLADLINK